jgi:hypothetical protein
LKILFVLLFVFSINIAQGGFVFESKEKSRSRHSELIDCDGFCIGHIVQYFYIDYELIFDDGSTISFYMRAAGETKKEINKLDDLYNNFKIESGDEIQFFDEARFWTAIELFRQGENLGSYGFWVMKRSKNWQYTEINPSANVGYPFPKRY